MKAPIKSRLTLPLTLLLSLAAAGEGLAQTTTYSYRSNSRAAVRRAYNTEPDRSRYFEILAGQSAAAMSLQFKNNGERPIYINDLGLSSSAGNIGPLKSIKWRKLRTTGTGPVTVRFGGFSKDSIIGGAVSICWERRAIRPQATTVKLDDSPALKFLFNSPDYLTLSTLSLSYDLMLRFAADNHPIEPFLGAGLGLSINSLKMPHVRGYTNAATFSVPVEVTGPGFLTELLAGVRFRVAGQMHLTAEMGYRRNTVAFDREISGERDTVTVGGTYYTVGAGFKF